MAKVNLEHDYPQISRPVGSEAEVKALGVPLRNVATCGPKVEGEAGRRECPAYGRCDREWINTRPRFEVMKIITKEGGIKTYHAPCFDNVLKEVELEANGGYSEVIGGEGDTYLTRGSVKRHPKRDPDCPDCIKGECNNWDDRDDLEVVCPTFPPAEEHPELIKFARIKQARTRGIVQRKEKRAAQLLTDHDTENARVIKRGKQPVDLELGKS